MRLIALPVSLFVLMTASAWPKSAAAQNAAEPLMDLSADSDRDIIVSDFDGHVILRFAGVLPAELDRDAIDEIAALVAAVEVPPELQADRRFEAEDVEADWASATARRIRRHILDAGPGYAEIHVECRSASCRAHLYEADRLTVREHQAELDLVQPVIAAFIADSTPEFEQGFLMAAYSEGLETPFIRVILRKAD